MEGASLLSHQEPHSNSLLPKHKQQADAEQGDSSDRNYREQFLGGEYEPEAFQEGSKNQRRPETEYFVLKTSNTKACSTFKFNMLYTAHRFLLFPFSPLTFPCHALSICTMYYFFSFRRKLFN